MSDDLFCDITEVTGSITKRIAVGFSTDALNIRTSGTLGGGTYGKYMYGEVRLDMLEIIGIAVTVISIIVTVISIVQNFKHEKSNRDSAKD